MANALDNANHLAGMTNNALNDCGGTMPPSSAATSGGPYAFVGTSTTTSFTDTTAGLANNTTAYYVLQFFASTGLNMCDSSEVGVTIPR